TPNTLVARINGRGETFHCHLEFCSSRWRADAGVVGEIVPGKRINAKAIPAGQIYEWRLAYDPKGADGGGLLTLSLNDLIATCKISKENRQDGATFTHFGLLPVLKSWDNPGEGWIANVIVNGKSFDLSKDPGWESFQN